MARRDLVIRITTGGVALIVWLAIFSCGLLLETDQYRRYLSPEYYQKLQATAPQSPATERYSGSTVTAFLVTTICYTPTNLVFLTLLAGLLGGCSSNVVAGVDGKTHPVNDSRSLMYLTESPWSAMMRSFIVYLSVIAGLYFVIDDPFKSPTPAQYMRLVGTLSVLAFVVGYDPSRIEQWLRLVPNPESTQTLRMRDEKSGVEMTATQGPTPTVEMQQDGFHDVNHIRELQIAGANNGDASFDPQKPR